MRCLNIRDITDRYLRKGQTFARIGLSYVCSKSSVKANTVTFEKVYSLYEALPYDGSDSILLLDKNDIISAGVKQYAIEPLTGEEAINFWDKTTPTEKIAFKKIIEKWGLLPKDSHIASALVVRMFKPVTRLMGKGCLSEVGWDDLLDSLLAFGGAEKDPRLKMVFKAHLLRGYKQAYNPHAIIATNPATGKTTFYDKAGARYDKVTANSLIGYAKGKNEVYFGGIHGQTRPLTIEQIESQVAESLLGFLLTFMESGKGTLHVGGVEMQVSGTCSIILTANPTGYDTDKIGTFKGLIDHLSTNHLALGRRFGIIVYGNAYKTADRTSYLNEEEWSMCFDLFRAIEEYAWVTISKIYDHSDSTRWLNAPIADYEAKVSSITEKIFDSGVRDFIKTHSKGAYQHLRGAAFNCAVVDLIPYIVENAEDGGLDMAVAATLNKAEDYLEDFISINLESFTNMVSLLETPEKIKEYLLASLPLYVKDIILTVDAYRGKERDIPREIPIGMLEPYYQGKKYAHIATLVDNTLKGRSRWKFYNQQLEHYFNFRLKEHNGSFVVEFK